MNLSMRINKKVENTDMRRLTTGILGKFYVVKHNCVICGVVNDYIMDNYMFRPVLAIFRLSYGNLRSYYKHARARGVEISTYGPY